MQHTLIREVVVSKDEAIVREIIPCEVLLKAAQEPSGDADQQPHVPIQGAVEAGRYLQFSGTPGRDTDCGQAARMERDDISISPRTKKREGQVGPFRHGHMRRALTFNCLWIALVIAGCGPMESTQSDEDSPEIGHSILPRALRKAVSEPG